MGIQQFDFSSQKGMRIVFVSHYFHPHTGGVEKHILKLSQELIKNGHSVLVITSLHNKLLKKKDRYQNIEILRIPFQNRKIVGLLQIWLWMLKNRNIFTENNIVHIHDVVIWCFPIKLTNPSSKIYSTFHGWEGTYPIPVKNILLKKISRLMSYKVVFVGKFIEKYYHVRPDLVIYGAVDGKFKKVKKDPKLVVYLGRLAGDTGLPVFLKAARSLNNYKIIFLGDGPLKKQCAKLGYAPGFVNPKKYLEKASICVASGYLSILEALSSGCTAFAAYDNPLKKDYFLLSPFASWINVSDSADELEHLIKIRRPKMSARVWANKQTWAKVSSEYLKLWTA